LGAPPGRTEDGHLRPREPSRRLVACVVSPVEREIAPLMTEAWRREHCPHGRRVDQSSRSLRRHLLVAAKRIVRRAA